MEDYSHSSSLATPTGSYCGDTHTPVPTECGMYSSPRLQEAAHLLSQLVGNYDADTLCDACLRLAETVEQADGECLQFLLDKDVVGTIIRMMRELPSHPAAQQAGCEVLLRCNEQVELRGMVEEQRAYRLVLDAMKNHHTDPSLLENALHTLASLAETALSDAGLKESRAYSYVLAALKKHISVVNVQIGGLLALSHMLKTDTYATNNMALRGEHKVLLDAMRMHSDIPAVVTYGCRALLIFASCEMGIAVMLDCEILGLAVDMLHKHEGDESVVSAVCGLMEALLATDLELPSLCNQLIELKVMDILTEILKQYPQVLEIQMHALGMLGHILALEHLQVEESNVEPWLTLIYNAFINHGALIHNGMEHSLQEAGCRCLAQLLEVNPHLHAYIGDDSGAFQIPLHNEVWKTLLNQITLLNQVNGPNPPVFQAVTLAIYFLVVDDESLQHLLLEKGAAWAVLEGLREFLLEPTKDRKCVEYGCRALIGLIGHNCHSKYKEDLMGVNVFDDLLKILDEFPHDPEVVYEAFGVVACLADVEEFQEAAVSYSLHREVLKAVERHGNHTTLVESSLEVFIILAENKSMIQQLNEAHTMAATVSIMKKHVVSTSIQRRGCLLIRLLCVPEYLTSLPLCTSVANVVVNALSRWRTEPEVQIEALACAHRLSQTSSEMAEALVKGDIHLLLFNMLYHVGHEGIDGFEVSILSDGGGGRFGEEGEEGEFIFQVGTEILFQLSCVQDLKQEMLATAVKDGLMEGANVLVDVGADVNAGKEPNTPICLAVQSQNKQMVEFLLQRGVNSVHKALSIARDKELDDIIGLLLEHMALDRNGDVINMSGLELRNIKTKWILPSLGVKNSHLRKNRSLGHLKKQLMHRKSIGCPEEMNFDALRKKWQSECGLDTNEPDSGVVTSRGQRESGNVTPSRKPSSSSGVLGSSVSSSRKASATSVKFATSDQNLADSIPDQLPNFSEHDPVNESETHDQGVDNMASELQEKLSQLATPTSTATKPFRKHKRAPSLPFAGFEPSLPPIRGTPSNTLDRHILQEDSGVGNLHLISPVRGESIDSDSTEGHSSRHTPRRRHQETQSTVTGARRLPFSSVEQYKQNVDDSLESPTHVNEEFSVTPMLLSRHLKRWRVDKRKKRFGLSSVGSSRPDSPVPIVYSRSDYAYYGGDQESSLDFSNPTSPRSSVSGSDTCTSPHHWFSPENSTYSQGNNSQITSREGLHLSLKERTPSSTSSSGLVTPATRSRRTSVDVAVISRMLGSGKDEVDFGYEAIPEDQPTFEASSRLVKVLDLSSNQINSFNLLVEEGDMVLWRLRGLERLDLKQNNLSQLPADMMQELRKLTILNLSCNHFSQFPKEAFMSKALVDVDLSANKISHLPLLSPLPNLSNLNLSSNLLEEFLPTLNGDVFPYLRKLNLKSNQIASIPKKDTKLGNLEELTISKNKIQEVPDEFLASLPSLKILDASRNELTYIPGEVAADLVFLQILKVGHNNLGRSEGEFNNFITLAPVIRTVDATENGLTSLPSPYAWKSHGVKDIRMNGNLISRLDLSDCGRYWPHLECLYLGQNKIKEIPKEIGQLKTLSCLDVSHNREIRHLPEEMGNLQHLFMLNLQGLKSLSLDPSILSGPTKSLISYLKSHHTKSVRYYHMKMMIVGAAGKGKTTLLHHLLQQKQPSTHRRNIATLGVNVKQWSYQHKQAGVTYHISCWDFAGQKEFYSTHQCFLTCRSLYVVVYNFSRGESELQSLLPWLLNIQARAPSSPVIIVGTHVDKIPQDEFEKQKVTMRTRIGEMIRRPGFPTEVSFAEVSCFDEKLVGVLRRKVKGLIDSAKLRGQKIMGGMVPSSYLALEELIEKEAKRMVRAKSRFPVLRASRLRELMEESKLSQKMDRAELDQAVHFLHECGVLLHYDDLQSKLSELYFLDPEWLCTLMAHIITVPEMNSFISPEGLLKEKSIHHLLKEPKFPSEFMLEYTKLLERFEVAHRQTPDTFLIPSHLPQKKPSTIVLPPANPGSQIVRRYCMCYIPPGFWPRLVARLIAFPKRALPRDQDLTPKILKMWSGGIFCFWSEQAFFLTELLTDKTNTFDIVVPTTKFGTRLLCAVVDNVEALLDEWYPGLRDFDILNGDELVQPMSLCPLCPITTTPHCFRLKHLQEVAVTADEVECPQHHGPVLLEHLAPDIVISDLDCKYKLSPEEFSLVESSANVLGKGGFGEVYKAMLRGQPVAVKIFNPKAAEINNTTAYHLIRQEVSILNQLEHPNIISMVAVCLRPKPMLLLEYAELGSLSTLYPYSNVSMTLKHRIAIQVASALAFLHKNDIIYRDLKADNVLLFSLSVIAKVNVKLSDYGIACYATESGLTQSTGTAGCKAPELLKAGSSKMPYNDKVDIYSYGLLLYVMMTNGHKPFEELSAGYEIDKAIEEGRPIEDIEHYGCPPWPDMQDLINHCLQFVPGLRPSAQEVFDRLCSAEFVSLKRAIPVGRDRSVETFTIRRFENKHGTKKANVEVWMASTLGNQTMLSIMNLSQKNASPQGTMLSPNVLVYCMAPIDSSLMLLGTNTGVVYVYDGYDRKLKHQLAPLGDSILCLLYFKSHTEGVYYVCAGLANGNLAFYDQYLINIPRANARVLTLGDGPVRAVKRLHGHLYVCCGSDIVVIKISDLSVLKRWQAVENSSGYLTCMDVGLDFVWTTHSKSTTVQLWGIDDNRLRGTLHCDVILNSQLPKEEPIDAYGARVTSLFLQPPPHPVLWLGLKSGHMLLINAVSRTPIMVAKRHVTSIRCIQSVKALVADKPVHLMLTAGFGFRQRPDCKAHTPSKGTPETYGSLLVWDSIMPRIKPNYDDIKKQQEPYR